MVDYPKEQLWELYEQLPKDLQKATFSEQVGQTIKDICTKNSITNSGVIFNITKNIGYVFLGLLPPNEFLSFLEKELKIEKNKAQQIDSEITKSVFLPVKKSLEALYEIKLEIRESKPETTRPQKTKKKDSYREPI